MHIGRQLVDAIGAVQHKHAQVELQRGAAFGPIIDAPIDHVGSGTLACGVAGWPDQHETTNAWVADSDLACGEGAKRKRRDAQLRLFAQQSMQIGNHEIDGTVKAGRVAWVKIEVVGLTKSG